MSTPQSRHVSVDDGTPDVELVARLVDGDESALGALYDRYSGLLMALLQRILGASGEAEEVLQETLLQVWKQAKRYDPSRSSVSNWLTLIARSRAIDRLRSRKVKERTASRAFAENPRVDASPEGARNVFHAERRERLRGALAEIPAEQRQVIELAFFHGMTQSEIAEKTATPLGTVKTRTLLAMKKLREQLRSELEELL